MDPQGYQLGDDPYGRRPTQSPGPMRLDIPMGPGMQGQPRIMTPSDRLMEQPTVSSATDMMEDEGRF